MTKLAFVDTETTGLDPNHHQIWELAIITESDDDPPTEYAWQLPVDLSRADPSGLRVGRFYERRWPIAGLSGIAKLHQVLWNGKEKWESAGLPVGYTAETVATLLDGAHMVGAVPSFDASFLGPWLRAHGQCPTFHYHLVDVEALAAGWLAGRISTHPDWRDPDDVHSPPWNSGDLSRAVGVDPEDFDRHTALGDARWARAIYKAVVG